MTMLGGKVRGVDNETKHLNLSNTDYLVCADKGAKEGGKLKPYGNKAIDIQKYNEKNNGHQIKIIKESVCLKLIGSFQPPRP